MLDDLALFVSVIESGSFARAAAARGVPPATLSRRIKALEESLGVRLLHRTAHSLTPTDAGRQYYERCRPLLVELGQITESLDDEIHALRGTIRVLAPVNMANTWLKPAWLRMMERFPEVRLDLMLSNRNQDLMGQAFDLAVRAGPQSDSSLVCRRIARIRTLLVAAPSYLERAGVPQTPHDLLNHRLLVAAPITRWSFTLRSDPTVHESLEVPGSLSVDEWGLVTTACVGGLGLLLVPLAQVYELLQSGQLVRVLPEWDTQEREAYLIWPNRDFVPARVRELISIITEVIAEQVRRTQPDV